MSANCPDFELLSAYADGEAAAEERRLLEAHLPGCRACAARLKSVKASKAAVAALPVPPMPADLRRRLLGPWSRRFGWFSPFALIRPLPTFAFAAACAALVLWARSSGLLSPRVEVPPELLMAAHNQYALTLPLASSERLFSELPVQLASGGEEARDVY